MITANTNPSTPFCGPLLSHLYPHSKTWGGLLGLSCVTALAREREIRNTVVASEVPYTGHNLTRLEMSMGDKNWMASMSKRWGIKNEKLQWEWDLKGRRKREETTDKLVLVVLGSPDGWLVEAQCSNNMTQLP